MTGEGEARPLWWTRQYVRSYTLTEEEAWGIISRPPFKCVMAWVTRDAKPVACEMAYQVLDGKIMLTSTTNRDKVRALRRNPAISICFQGGGLKQVTVRGRVEFNDDPKLVRRWAEQTVDGKWTGAEREREIGRYLSPDRVMMVVEVEKILSFDGEKMFADERGEG